MLILLGYETALEYWRSLATSTDPFVHKALLGDFLERKNATIHLEHELPKRPARKAAGEYLAEYPNAQVVLIGRQHRQRGSRPMRHALAAIPPNSCIRANAHFRDHSLYVGTPEFCFLQMATRLSLEDLIALGFELCGSYARQRDATVYESHPLTSRKKLERFLSSAEGFAGVKKARRALRYVVDGSASPMETALTMMLCLPYSLGGYGLEFPLLNRRVEIPHTLKKQLRSPYYVCDLYWEGSALAIEYDSDLAHSGIYKTAKDAQRRSALTAMGISVLSVTRVQLLDREAFDGIAHMVAKATGKRLRYDKARFKWVQHRLRTSLLHPPRA